MSSAYFKNGSLIESFTSTATAAGTTTLTASSDAYQIFTGSTTQTLVLPNATTLIANQKFEVVNTSTGAITVNANGGGNISTVAAGSTMIFRVTDISTSAGSWDSTTAASGGAGGLSTAESGQFNTLAAGGFSAQSKILKFNPEEVAGNFWLTKATGTATGESCSQMSFNGYFYTVGAMGSPNSGANSTAATTRFNDDNNAWLSRTVLPVTTFLNCGSAAGGFGYSFGGLNNTQTVNREGYKYNDSTDAWSTIATATTALAYQAVGYDGNEIYLMGGQNAAGSPVTSNAYVFGYDPTNNTYSLSGIITSGTGRYGPAGFVLNQLMYLIGGRDASNTYQANTDIINFASKSVRVGPTISQAKFGMGSGAALGQGYVIGGTNSVGGGTSVTTMERLNPDGSLWTTVASMTVARRLINSAGSLNGNIYAVGGVTESANTIQSIVESYIPSAMFNFGSLKKSTTTPASISIAVLLNALTPNTLVQLRTDGDKWKGFLNGASSTKTGETVATKFLGYPQVWVFGGSDNTDSTNYVQRYSEEANTWSASLVTLPAARSSHFSFNPDASGGYILGGTLVSNGTPTNILKFSDLTNAFTAKSNISTKTTSAGAFDLNGFGYYFGGGIVGGLGVTANNFLYNTTTDAYTSKTALPTINVSQGAVSTAGFGYSFAGQTNVAYINNTYEYNDVTDAWASKTNFPVSTGYIPTIRRNDLAIMMGNVASGGSTNGNTYSFNRISNSFTTLTTAPGNSGGGCPNRYGDYLYVSTGYGTGGAIMNENYRLSLEANVWATRQTTTQAVAYANMTSTFSGSYRNYEIRVGVPAYYAGVGSGVWVSKANMTQTQFFCATFTVGSNLYGGGGGLDAESGGNRTNKLQKFDSINNAWIMETSGPLSAADTGGFASNATLGGKGFFSGHNAAGSLDGTGAMYEPVTRVWNTIATGPGSGQGNLCPVLNQFGYSISGGPGVSGQQTATNRYVLSTNSWTNGIATLNNRHYEGVAGVMNGFIYATGDGAVTANHEQFNDASNSWANKTSIPTANEAAGAFVVDDGLHNAAGYVGATSTFHYVYKDSLNIWVSMPSYPSAHYGPLGGSIGGNGYLAGGYNGSAYDTLTFEWVNSLKQAVLSAGLTVS